MNKAYSRINWQNDPNHTTPLNATNLNAMDSALDTIDDRVVALDSGKSSVTMTPALQSGTKVADYSIDGVSGSLYAPAGGGASALTDLTDTAISSPSNGQVLKYNSSTSKWENANESGGGGGSSSLSGLSDVALDTLADGESLVYDSATSKWKDKQLTATDVGAMSSSAGLNNLSDVTTSSPTNGQVLGYDGSKWKNVNAPSGGGGHTIKNESGTALTQRDNLQFKGCSVSDDSTNNATVVSVQTSNRNLLDNPWFTVNQKGVTSGSFNTDSYQFDRWKIAYGGSPSGSYASWSLSDGILTFDARNTNYVPYFYNKLETPLEVGKQYTISIMYEDNTVNSHTFVARSSGNEIGNYVNGIAPAMFFSGFFMIRGSQNAYAKIKAVKLEIGSQSTLAYDTAPNYTTELLKCQRYLQPINAYTVLCRSPRVATTWWGVWNLPVPFRATPTLSVTSKELDLFTSSSYAEEMNPTINMTNSGNVINLVVQSTASGKDGSSATLMLTGGWLDAQL